MKIIKWLRNLWKKDPEFMDINPDHASLKKVLYWRIISVVISMLVAYYYLHEWLTSLEMTLVEAVILTTTHYVFEELWPADQKNVGKQDKDS